MTTETIKGRIDIRNKKKNEGERKDKEMKNQKKILNNKRNNISCLSGNNSSLNHISGDQY